MKLQDRYDVVRTLGEGGFGRVYLVRDRETRQLFAAKELATVDSASAQRMFKREVRQLERYKNLPVIGLVASYTDAEPPYFVMRYAEGGSLHDRVGLMTEAQILTVMAQLMETLARVHADGGFHRDIKPENILVCGDGRTVVADWGAGNSPHCTEVLTCAPWGTPGYRAPRLTSDGEFTLPDDVFSAGATWHHLITGSRPLSGCLLPLDPRRNRAETAVWIADLICKMTNPDPALRPTSDDVAGRIRERIPPKMEELLSVMPNPEELIDVKPAGASVQCGENPGNGTGIVRRPSSKAPERAKRSRGAAVAAPGVGLAMVGTAGAAAFPFLAVFVVLALVAALVVAAVYLSYRHARRESRCPDSDQ